MLDGVAVVGPLEDEQRERGEENVERFYRHGAELEEYCRLQRHEERGEEGEQRLPGPGDNREEHEQERERQHQELGIENPVEVGAEQRHAEVIEEGEPLRLEAVGLGDAL